MPPVDLVDPDTVPYPVTASAIVVMTEEEVTQLVVDLLKSKGLAVLDPQWDRTEFPAVLRVPVLFQ